MIRTYPQRIFSMVYIKVFFVNKKYRSNHKILYKFGTVLGRRRMSDYTTFVDM